MYKKQLYDRMIIELTGKDCLTLLNSMLSKNIFKLSATNSMYALQLTPQGKFFCDMFIMQKDSALWLDLNQTMVESFLERLQFYKLRAQVEAKILSHIKIYTLYDITDFNLLNLEEKPGFTKAEPEFLIFVDPRLKDLGVRCYMPQTNPTSLEDYPIGDYNKWRIELAVCEGGHDLIPTKSFPMQFGLDHLNAIDFDKGCYVGQEVTARTKYRGNIRKSIYAVTGEMNLTSHANIYIGDRLVGNLLSSIGNKAIGLIDNDIDTEKEELKAENIKLSCHRPSWS